MQSFKGDAIWIFRENQVWSFKKMFFPGKWKIFKMALPFIISGALTLLHYGRHLQQRREYYFSEESTTIEGIIA